MRVLVGIAEIVLDKHTNTLYPLVKGVLNMKPQCPDCKCETVYYRLKSKTFICRRCGNEWNKKKEILINESK